MKINLHYHQILTLEEKSELLKHVAYVSSADNDYFVIKNDDDTYAAIVCETYQKPNEYHRVIVVCEQMNRDDAVASMLEFVKIDTKLDN
ncbi:MAG: hypothetical protein ACEQSB_00150 [Undibacterium sp.]